jgi:hypothetical protein
MILTNTLNTSNSLDLKFFFPPLMEEEYFSQPSPLAAGKLKLGSFALHQLSVSLLEPPKIYKSESPNLADEPLRHLIASLSPLVIGYLLPSFTLNRNEWGSGLEIPEVEDSH